MPGDEPQHLSRRMLLTNFGALGVGALVMPVGPAHAQQVEAPAADEAAFEQSGGMYLTQTVPVEGYQSLSLDEAAIVEAVVAHMWPADELTPDGVALGIATFIDRQLAGAYGQGDRLYLNAPFRRGKPEHGYQFAFTPERYFKAGLRHLSEKSLRLYSTTPDRLSAEKIDNLLLEISSKPQQVSGFDLNTWFNELFYPLFVRGAFSDPIYGGNRSKQAWKMIGYPGLPATYTTDMVTYRGRRHPASDSPMSIQDFS